MKRDWGYAKDYVEAMWLMLQQSTPEDYVLASGVLTSVRQFVEMAFRAVDIHLKWEGEGLEEKGIDQKTGERRVEISSQFFRKAEDIPLRGDASKARDQLQWTPKTSIEQLIELMVASERALH